MTGARTFLGAEQQDESTWTFSMPREIHGAFGGAFGGAVAAAALVAARPVAPGRIPASIDSRFLRPLAAGGATAVATVVHTGRSLTCVSVDVADERGRLACRSTLTLVEPSALEPIEVDGGGAADAWPTWADGRPWRNAPGVEAPIIDTLSPRILGADDRGHAIAVAAPWAGDEDGAEAACFVADLCVGPPVAAAVRDRWVPHPNPDISLRLPGSGSGEMLIGVGRLARVEAGLATVAVEVSRGGSLVALGVSTSVFLARS